MLKALIFGLVTGCPFWGMAQAPLHVTVKGIKYSEGEIRVGLFADERDFLKKIIAGKTVVAKGDSVTVAFENLPPGAYAVSVFHDRNWNGKLDTNVLGIPKEGFAFGNNAMGLFGPPSFDKAKVTIDTTPVRQVLNLKHF